MRRNVLVSAVLASAVSIVLSTHANADNENFSANLSGFSADSQKSTLVRVLLRGNLKPLQARREPSSPPARAPSN
jgi:hypothetical protein